MNKTVLIIIFALIGALLAYAIWRSKKASTAEAIKTENVVSIAKAASGEYDMPKTSALSQAEAILEATAPGKNVIEAIASISPDVIATYGQALVTKDAQISTQQVYFGTDPAQQLFDAQRQLESAEHAGGLVVFGPYEPFKSIWNKYFGWTGIPSPRTEDGITRAYMWSIGVSDAQLDKAFDEACQLAGLGI